MKLSAANSASSTHARNKAVFGVRLDRPAFGRPFTSALLVVLMAAGTIVAIGPTSRAATVFTVNTTTDAVDVDLGDDICETATGTGSCSLRAAIQQANALPGPDSIEFALLADNTYELGLAPLNENGIASGDLDITDDLTITGLGKEVTIIDGGVPPPGSPPDVKGLDRLFEIHPGVASVNISRATLREGSGVEYGGAIHNAGSATVNISSSILRGNFAWKMGGAINNHAGGTVEITNSNLEKNGAVEAGSAANNNANGELVLINTRVADNKGGTGGEGVPDIAGGAAINNNGELDTKGTVEILSNSRIIDNVAGGERLGGGVNNAREGTVLIEDSRIMRNTSQSGGGGVSNGSGTVTIVRSEISGNSAPSGGGINNEGLVGKDGSVGEVVVEDTLVSGNIATADGGGISNNSAGHLVVRGSASRIANNTATTYGGGVYTTETATAELIDTTIEGNDATEGGGFYNNGDGRVTMEGVRFSNNSATFDGGGLHNTSDGELVMSGTIFSGNDAGRAGGGIYSNGDGTLQLDGIVLGDDPATLTVEPGNTAITDGGGIAIESGQISLTDATITGNDAGGSGGGIVNSGDGTFVIDGATISGNVAGAGGGGISSDSDGAVRVSNALISLNSAHDGGGMHVASDAALSITNVTFSENTAQGGNGGGLANMGDAPLTTGQAELASVTFSMNHALADATGLGGNGGGLYAVGDGLINLDAATFDSNTADGLGGGVLFAGAAPFTITNSEVTANSAHMGGGLAIGSDVPVTLKNSEVGRNIAEVSGGGLYMEGDAPTVVAGSLLTGNQALGGNGGAVNVESASPMTFTDTAINRTVITGNSAKKNGGGVYAIDGNSLLFDRVTLSGNAAGADGGAVYTGGTRVTTIQLSELLANTAGDNGGAVSSADSSAGTIDRSTLADNTADVKGGALAHQAGGTMTVLASTFARNRAKNGGAIRNEGDGTLSVENSTFSTNYASERGGGLSLGTVDSKTFLLHATVYKNEAPLGGGIAMAGLKTSFFVQNTIVAKSVGSLNCAGTLTSGGGNIDSAASCSFRATGDDRNIDLQLHPLADNGGRTPTHALPNASPAIDSALRSPCLTNDQRGIGRPQGPACDVGAFEARPGVDITPACGGTINVKADADSWITEASPMNNFGNDSILKVRSQGSANFRALVHFSLPSLPAGCILASAKLRLHASSSATGRTLQAIPIAEAWTETDVRWDNQPTTTGSAVTRTSVLGFNLWTVTDQVNAMYAGPNYGFLIRDAAEGEGGSEQSFHSREKAPDKPPVLILKTG